MYNAFTKFPNSTLTDMYPTLVKVRFAQSLTNWERDMHPTLLISQGLKGHSTRLVQRWFNGVSLSAMYTFKWWTDAAEYWSVNCNLTILWMLLFRTSHTYFRERDCDCANQTETWLNLFISIIHYLFSVSNNIFLYPRLLWFIVIPTSYNMYRHF